MSLLDETFSAARAEGRALLIGYLPAGFPSYDEGVTAITAMVEGGVDAVLKEAGGGDAHTQRIKHGGAGAAGNVRAEPHPQPLGQGGAQRKYRIAEINVRQRAMGNPAATACHKMHIVGRQQRRMGENGVPRHESEPVKTLGIGAAVSRKGIAVLPVGGELREHLPLAWAVRGTRRP